MMFSYQKAKNTLIFAIIAIGAITAIGIASTSDNGANESTNNGITNFGESENNVPLGWDNGGGMPSSWDNGGGMPSSYGSVLGWDNGGGMPS